jgi:hypothetical protein
VLHGDTLDPACMGHCWTQGESGRHLLSLRQRRPPWARPSLLGVGPLLPHHARSGKRRWAVPPPPWESASLPKKPPIHATREVAKACAAPRETRQDDRLAIAARPHWEEVITSQGRPRTTFARALQNGNLYVAEALAREIGRISLAEALELTILIGRKEPRRARSATRRAAPGPLTVAGVAQSWPIPPESGSRRKAGPGSQDRDKSPANRPLDRPRRHSPPERWSSLGD